jgi:hypothetical protein
MNSNQIAESVDVKVELDSICLGCFTVFMESKKYKNTFIESFIEKLSKENCLKFKKYYKKIYMNLDLNETDNNIMVLHL